MISSPAPAHSLLARNSALFHQFYAIYNFRKQDPAVSGFPMAQLEKDDPRVWGYNVGA